MRIAQLTPGSGDSFYCENCLRDAALVRAFQEVGHDILMIPMYLPLHIEAEEPVNSSPIFFGGVNVYLQQKSGIFRRTPRWFDNLFDSPKLLEWAGKKSGMTNTQLLGQTTLSMLKGENGKQRKELNRLVEWLEHEKHKPDIVILSNILLAGLAKSIKEKLKVPIVCLLQDEDGFLDSLKPPYNERAWTQVRQCTQDIDAFLAVSQYYAEVMKKRLSIYDNKVYTAYTGISLDGFGEPAEPQPVPAIGFLSRMCRDKGLDTLVEAFFILRKDKRLKNVRLKIAGGQTGIDKQYIDRIHRRLNCWETRDKVEYYKSFGREDRISFLRNLTVLSVPERKPVAYGMYVLEALGMGVPVVQPDEGVFPELIEITGGGRLYKPNNAAALAEGLKPFLLEPQLAANVGRNGRDVVFAKFNIEHTAGEMVRFFEDVLIEKKVE